MLLDERAEGEPKDEDARAAQGAERPLQPGHAVRRLLLVDLPAQLHHPQRRLAPACVVDGEVGIHGGAVAADADARLQDARLPVRVRRADHVEHVQADLLAVAGQFIGQGDVRVAVDHAGQLDHLGRFERAHVDDGRAEVAAVEARRALRRRRA